MKALGLVGEDLIVAALVALAVGAPVSVAALVNRNDIVKVIDAVRRSRLDELREHGNGALEQVDAALVNVELLEVQHASDMPPTSQVACSFTGVDHGHGFVPAHERGHDPGRDHAHGHAHAHGHGVSHRF